MQKYEIASIEFFFPGKTNYTGLLSKQGLTKARIQWLLPLSQLVTEATLGFNLDDDEDAAGMRCAINSLEIVLQHCLELTQEALELLTK